MKMKKIICSLMISVLCFMTAISGVSAANTYPTANIDTAVQRAINFYKGRTLESPDEVFAAESLGVEVEDQCDISELLNAFKEVNYNEAKLGDLSKTIITLALTKNDPRNFNNYNLVEILENKVKEDGEVQLVGFGKFKKIVRPNARNPKTKTKVEGEISYVSFSQSQTFKDIVNNK